MSTKWGVEWINKHIMVYLYNEILYNKENEWMSIKHKYMENFQI